MAAGARLAVAGTLRAKGGLTLRGGVLSLAGAGSGLVEVGGVGDAARGRIAVDRGATLAGFGQLSAAVTDAGTIEARGGALTFGGKVAGTGTLAIAPGAALLAGSSVQTRIIEFLAGGNETLAIRAPAAVSSSLTGFGIGDSIDLVGISATSASFAGHVLTVSGRNGLIGSLHFAGSYASASFILHPDQHGGTDIAFKH